MENDGASWRRGKRETGAAKLHLFGMLYESNNLCIALERCRERQPREGERKSRGSGFGFTAVNLFWAFKCGKFDIINLCN